MPVITSTDGRWRRQDEVDADRARFCAMADAASRPLRRRHNQVGELVDGRQQGTA